MDLRRGGRAQEGGAGPRPGRVSAVELAPGRPARVRSRSVRAPVPVCVLPAPERLGFTFRGQWGHR
jgi:hypothetical protein